MKTAGAEAIAAADEIMEAIGPLLAGRDPEWQSAVLAEVTARWLAGWHPAKREEAFKAHNQLVLQLTAVNELLRFGPDRHPGWKDLEKPQ